MSSLRKGAPPPRMKKKNSDTAVVSNGNGSTSLYYANDPPDDENMNEIADENVELTVLLPEGNVRDTSVNSNIPMMDLLVNLAAMNKLSPAGYTIVVLNEETRKPVDYKPNQTIGSLCPKNVNGTPRHLTLQLAPKKGDSEKQRNVKNAQPFEMTKRFTVNLPQNQKKVLRISPNTQLEVIRQQICSEKHLDPFRYTFQLPSDPYNNLDMQLTVGDLKSQEINMTGADFHRGMFRNDFSTGTVNSAMSMPNLSGNQRTEQNLSYMPSGGETKKKKGFFSFLKKDNSKKFSVQSVQRDAYVEQPPPSREGPIRSTSQDTPSEQSNRNPGARPKTMYAVSTSNLDKISDAKMTVPPLDLSGLNNSQNASTKSKSMTALKAESEKVFAPPRKKRRAPPPPQAQSVQNTVQVEVSVEKQKMEKQVKSKQEIRQRTENISNKYHSRNSSDSSGYHELTLSGAESPDGPRIDEHLEGEINVETASLDSGGLLNGDSGIRDISPSSRRKDIDGEIGSSQTLPLERTKKKAVSSSTPRSSSLDRTGKKKKAPPPPPGPPPQPPVKISISSTAPAPKTKKKDDDVAINAVLDSLDQNLDDQDTSGEGMMMVENSSIHSEDIDVDLTFSHQPRPCAFIAPPPPLEPPPDDSEPVDYNMIINGRVDTVDVGVETSDDSNSYGPVSTRSSTDSPVSMHSRAESHTSISSVNTVDDVSMDFERTIAVCQEEVMRAEQETPEYKQEMAQFVEKMKEMTVDGSKKAADDFDEDVTSNEAVADDAVYIFSKDNGDDSDEMESIPQSESKQSEKDQIQNMRNSDREVSEITYDFKINTVPPEFQSGMEAPDEVEFKDENKEVQNEKEEEEEEEEIVITETFEIIYPFSEPEKVEAEVETEHTEVSYVTEKKPEVKMEELQTIQDKIQDVAKVPQIIQEEKVIPKEPEKPKPKEEFVLTFDDLSKVDFSLMRKKKKIQPKPKPTYQSTPEKRHTVATLDEIKSNFAINNDNVFITPTKGHNLEMDDGFIITEAGSVRGHKGEVKTKCSELSFSPNSEGEMEHVLEEKSISMINLPAVRASLDSSIEENKSEDNVKDDIVVSRTEIVFSVNSNSTKQEDDSSGRQTSLNSNLEKSVNDSGVEAESDSNIDHQEVLTAQYKQLQQQFSTWKIQLEENKKLLSSSQAIPSDETTKQFQQQLQSQIQLQQQMIQQMQQSMEALSSQQQQGGLVDQSSQNNLPSSLDKSSQKQISVDIGNHVDQTIEPTSVKQTFVPPPPVAPALPNGKAIVEVTSSNEQTKPKSKSKPRKYIEPKLDPREELMIAIKNFGGRSAMKKVPVNKTHWHSGIP